MQARLALIVRPRSQRGQDTSTPTLSLLHNRAAKLESVRESPAAREDGSTTNEHSTLHETDEAQVVVSNVLKPIDDQGG